MNEYYHSSEFQHSESVELTTLKNLWHSHENKQAEWLAAIIDSGKNNPQAFSNYLLKNGFIKTVEP